MKIKKHENRQCNLFENLWKPLRKPKENIFALPLTFAQYFRVRPCVFPTFVNSKHLFWFETNARRGMFHHGLLIWGDTFSGVYRSPHFDWVWRDDSFVRRKSKYSIRDGEQLKTFCDPELPCTPVPAKQRLVLPVTAPHAVLCPWKRLDPWAAFSLRLTLAFQEKMSWWIPSEAPRSSGSFSLRLTLAFWEKMRWWRCLPYGWPWLFGKK